MSGREQAGADKVRRGFNRRRLIQPCPVEGGHHELEANS